MLVDVKENGLRRGIVLRANEKRIGTAAATSGPVRIRVEHNHTSPQALSEVVSRVNIFKVVPVEV